MRAFRIYTLLARDNAVGKEWLQEYMADDVVRGLVDQFAREVDCVTIIAGEQLYMIPETRLSPFHMNNEVIKRAYLRANAVNADLYLMYVSIIVLIGAFYDSYQTMEPTRSFIGIEEWTALVNERIALLKTHPEAELRELEQEFSYNWTALIEKWSAMDDIKETAARQSGNTISRVSFMDSVRKFLVAQELVIDIGNQEITLTEKAKVVVQRYFMELEYNRGILEFLYQSDAFEGEGSEHASHL
ncbi:non-ribosomal peptide synthetase module [Paenibacillus frigoriresistens]|nr:non-ribosomal peptide synthetase module [Paenibacillus frigoriresistens]